MLQKLCTMSILPISNFYLPHSDFLWNWWHRFAKFCGIVTMESFAASAMGLTVGAMVPSTEAAMAVGPSLMTVFIVFGGYYVNAENTPLVFRWIPRVSLIRWYSHSTLSSNIYRHKLIIYKKKTLSGLSRGFASTNSKAFSSSNNIHMISKLGNRCNLKSSRK